MKEKILLICGGSGAGKDTIARLLEEVYGFKVLKSYTTRDPRYPYEDTHTFITDNDLKNFKKENIICYSEHYDYKYFATRSQVEENDIYIVDLPGIEMFKKEYKGNKTHLVIHIEADDKIRKKRMINRGDSEETAKRRIEKDRAFIEEYKKIADINILNHDFNTTLKALQEFIKKYKISYDINTYVGHNLRRIRKKKRLTQKEFGYLIGMDIRTVSRMENGYNNITLKHMSNIMKGLNIEAEKIFEVETYGLF